MIAVKQGTQEPINFTLKYQDAPVDLSGNTIVFQVKIYPEQTDNFLVEKNITETSDPYEDGNIYNATGGKFNVFLKEEDTLNLCTEQVYYYALWRVRNIGTEEETRECISSNAKDITEFRVCPA